MSAGNAGSVVVDLDADLSKYAAKLAEARADAQKLITDIEGKPARIELDAETTAATSEIRRIDTLLGEVSGRKTSATVTADATNATRELTDIEQIMQRVGNARTTVTALADTDNALTDLRRLETQLAQIDDRPANLEVRADVKRAIDDLQQVRSEMGRIDDASVKAGGSVGRFGSTGKASMGSLADAISPIPLGMAGVGIGAGLAAKALFDMAKSAAEDQASVDRLNQAVLNAEGSLEGHAGALRDAVAAGQELAFSDDQTRAALSLMTAQTGSADEALRRLSTAQDLARGAGIDLASAAKLIGKTSDENTTALQRMGIAVTGAATAQDVLNAVDAKFGGQAGTYAETDAAKFDRAADSIDEMKEAIGAGLLPILATMATEISETATGIGALITKASELRAVVFGGDTGGNNFASAFSAAIQATPLGSLADAVGYVQDYGAEAQNATPKIHGMRMSFEEAAAAANKANRVYETGAGGAEQYSTTLAGLSNAATINAQKQEAYTATLSRQAVSAGQANERNFEAANSYTVVGGAAATAAFSVAKLADASQNAYAGHLNIAEGFTAAAAGVGHYETAITNAEGALEILAGEQAENGTLTAGQQAQYDILTGAVGRYKGGIEDSEGAVVDAAVAQANYTFSLDALNTEFENGSKNPAEYARRMAELVATTDPAAASAYGLAAAQTDLATAMDGTINKLGNLLVDLGLLPESARTQFETLGLPEEQTAVENFTGAVNDVPPAVSTDIGATDSATPILNEAFRLGEGYADLNPNTTVTAADEATVTIEGATKAGIAFAESNPITQIGATDNATAVFQEIQGPIQDYIAANPITAIGATDNATSVFQGLQGPISTYRDSNPNTIASLTDNASGAIGGLNSAIGAVDRAIIITASINTDPFYASLDAMGRSTPHSPAEEGPFKKLPNWDFLVEGVAPAIDGGTRTLQGGMGEMAAYLPMNSPADTGPLSSNPNWDFLFGGLEASAGKYTADALAHIKTFLDTAKSAFDTFGAGLAVGDQLALGSALPTDEQLGQLADRAEFAVASISESAALFRAKGLEKATEFANTAKTIFDLFGSALSAFAGEDVRIPTDAEISDLKFAIEHAVQSITDTALILDADGVAAAETFAASAAVVMDLVGSAADAFANLTDVSIPDAAHVSALKFAIEHAVQSIIDTAQILKAEGVQSAAAFASSAATIMELIGSAADAFTGFDGLEIPDADRVAALKFAIEHAVQSIVDTALVMDSDGLVAAESFSTSASTVMELIGGAVDTFSGFTDLAIPDDDRIARLKFAIEYAVQAIVDTARVMDSEGVAASQQFSESATAVFELLGSAIEAFSGDGWTIPSDARITQLKASIEHAVQSLADTAAHLDVAGVAAAAVFATNAGQVLDLISTAVDALASLAGLENTIVAQTGIDAVVSLTVRMVEALSSASLMVAGPALASATIYASQIDSVLGIVTTAVDAIAALAALETAVAPQAAITAIVGLTVRLATALASASAQLGAGTLPAATAFADGIGAVLGIVGSGVEAIASLQDLTNTVVPQDAINALVDLAIRLTAAMEEAATHFDENGLAAASRFAEAGGSVLGMIAGGVEGLAALGDAKFTSQVDKGLEKFLDLVERVTKRLEDAGEAMGEDGTDAAQRYAEAASSVVDLLASASGDFSGLGAFGANVRKGIDSFASGIETAVDAIAALGAKMDSGLDDAVEIAEKIAKIVALFEAASGSVSSSGGGGGGKGSSYSGNDSLPKSSGSASGSGSSSGGGSSSPSQPSSSSYSKPSSGGNSTGSSGGSVDADAYAAAVDAMYISQGVRDYIDATEGLAAKLEQVKAIDPFEFVKMIHAIDRDLPKSPESIKALAEGDAERIKEEAKYGELGAEFIKGYGDSLLKRTYVKQDTTPSLGEYDAFIDHLAESGQALVTIFNDAGNTIAIPTDKFFTKTLKWIKVGDQLFDVMGDWTDKQKKQIALSKLNEKAGYAKYSMNDQTEISKIIKNAMDPGEYKKNLAAFARQFAIDAAAAAGGSMADIIAASVAPKITPAIEAAFLASGMADADKTEWKQTSKEYAASTKTVHSASESILIAGKTMGLASAEFRKYAQELKVSDRKKYDQLNARGALDFVKPNKKDGGISGVAAATPQIQQSETSKLINQLAKLSAPKTQAEADVYQKLFKEVQAAGLNMTQVIARSNDLRSVNEDLRRNMGPLRAAAGPGGASSLLQANGQSVVIENHQHNYLDSQEISHLVSKQTLKNLNNSLPVGVRS